MAYDTIMVFPDQFRKHILPDQIHILNVAFMVPDMRREYRGTGGNIAYNLRLLGEAPALMATVGHDFGALRTRLAQLGICSPPRAPAG
jgi:adenosine kinase